MTAWGLVAVFQMPFDISDQLFGPSGLGLAVTADALLVGVHSDQHV